MIDELIVTKPNITAHNDNTQDDGKNRTNMIAT